MLLPIYDAQKFKAGLLDVRDNHLWGGAVTYYFNGTRHIHIKDDAYYVSRVNNLSIADWTEKILNFEATHVAE